MMTIQKKQTKLKQYKINPEIKDYLERVLLKSRHDGKKICFHIYEEESRCCIKTNVTSTHFHNLLCRAWEEKKNAKRKEDLLRKKRYLASAKELNDATRMRQMQNCGYKLRLPVCDERRFLRMTGGM